MISYLLDVSLCWLIFYLLYYCWLSKETFFHLNRWYLLGTLLLGLLIPVLPSPFTSGGAENDWVTLYVAPITMGLESLQVTVSAPAVMEEHFDWLALLSWIYWVGVLITGIRFFSGLWRIGTLYQKAEHIQVGQFQVALTPEVHLPFSFFQVIFKSKLGVLDDFAEEKITDHELAHVRGWHTIDVLLVELVSIFLWCSPPVYLYRRSLRIVHEYIADSAAIRSGEKKQYGHLLIRQSQSGLELALANHFIQSQLKKRIMMMTKTRSTRQAILKYLPVIPLLIVAFMIFSNWEAVASDPLDLLSNTMSDNIEVIAPFAAEDFDPQVFRKKLSAILYKRQHATENPDAALAKGFAALHNEWADKYPEHGQEIRKIAAEVADQYELELSFTDNKVMGAYFKKPFESVKSNPDVQIRGSSEAGVKIGMPEGAAPYVLINDKPAPPDWKANLVPENIQSINVLKGESAVTAYGDKAKDGAIQIYTKDFAKANTILPRFPGCENIPDVEKRNACAEANLMEYVFSNIKYPEAARKQNVQGLVVASYVVDKNGKVKDVKILKSIGAAFDDEVIRVLTNLPKQVPGTMNGQPADVEMKLPIKFKATDEETKDPGNLPSAKVIISKLNNAKQQPLFVIDGEIWESAEIKDIDPNDIESIDVLKGEQAIAEYGEKGANGVVRISTKTRIYDRSPIFAGCEGLEGDAQVNCSQKSFLESVYKNILYPATAREQRIQGTVIVKYTIGTDGKIQNPAILKGIGGGCDEEVLRIIRAVPDWKPAMKDGKPVAVEMILPVQYRLEGEANPDRVTEKEINAEDDIMLKKMEGKFQPAIGKAGEKIVVTGYGTSTARKETFKVVEEMPRFPGCEEDPNAETRAFCSQKRMLEFVYNNISYPKAAKDAGIEGMVIASFVVTKTGQITDARIERGLGYGLNELVLASIEKMPTWIPGKQNGKVVDVVYNLPVRFKLGEGDKAKKEPTTVHVNGPESTPAVSKLDLRNFKAAPNPSNGLITLKFQAEAQPLNIRIMSANGQAVYQRELPQFSGSFDEQVDLQDAPKGTLFITIQQGDKVHSSTIIVQ